MERGTSEGPPSVVRRRASYGCRPVGLVTSGRDAALACRCAHGGHDQEDDESGEGANLIAIHAQQDAFAGHGGHRADGQYRTRPAVRERPTTFGRCRPGETGGIISPREGSPEAPFAFDRRASSRI